MPPTGVSLISLRTTNSCIITRQDIQYSLLAATYSSAFSGSRSFSAPSPSSHPSTDIQERPERVFQKVPQTNVPLRVQQSPDPPAIIIVRDQVLKRMIHSTWPDALNQVFFKISIAAVCIVGSRTSTRVQVMRVTSLSGFCRRIGNNITVITGHPSTQKVVCTGAGVGVISSANLSRFWSHFIASVRAINYPQNGSHVTLASG
jgi:hypothetical protein